MSSNSCVEARRVLHDAVRRPAFVEDRHGRAVEFGVLQDVLVDEVAEDLAGLRLLLAEDGRAGEADDRRVGQRLAQVAVQRARVRTMRLVHQHEDLLATR